MRHPPTHTVYLSSLGFINSWAKTTPATKSESDICKIKDLMGLPHNAFPGIWCPRWVAGRATSSFHRVPPVSLASTASGEAVVAAGGGGDEDRLS